MKKIILLAVVFFITSLSHAQEEKEKKSETNFNKFSIEGAVGVNKPDNTFTSGYFSSDPTKVFPLNNINHFNLGFRYMFNERFGLKLDGAYDVFQPQSGSSGSLPFETTQLRVGVQGVVNLRNILNFDSFTKRFGLLGHAGVQVNWLQPESNNGVDISDGPADRNGGFIIGFTPQYRLSNRFVVTADASFLHNFRTHKTWDGLDATESNLTSSMLNVSLGLTVYLGKHDVHADWVSIEDSPLNDDIEDLKTKVANFENMLKDDDGDGVPNYLDKDPNTPKGAIVNTHGQAVDTNGSGIPDALEGPLDERYGGKMDVVKELANRGVIAVYFDFDVSVPQNSSYDDIKSILLYMRDKPSSKVTITGYADEIGATSYNDPLSTRRAEKVKDILVLAGIDASRITTVGGGEDTSVDKNSEYARQLVRRATFTIE